MSTTTSSSAHRERRAITGHVYACGPCIAELDHMVRVQAYGRDGIADRAVQSATLTVPAHVPAPHELPAGEFAGPSRLPRRKRDRAPEAGREDTMTEAEACEHRQIEKRDGKTYCRTCKRQIYL